MLGFISRRMFLQLAALFGAHSLTATPTNAQAPKPGPSPRWTGTVLQADEGESLVAGRRRGLMRIKVDSTKAVGATMSMVVSEVAPGASIPVHSHRNEDELIFLHTGTGIVTLGDRRVPSSAGAMLYAPKGTWHGIENTGPDVLTWCAVWSPPGFEQFFRETGVPPGVVGKYPTPARIAESARKYGMLFRDPT
jgi:mannose-6-phosphate isomerase-like protein (cupin superfamily)